MKTIKYEKSRPKLSNEIVNKKQTQTRSTLNSGRSSTNNNNKRHSHQFSYQTELFKNLNKSTTLCLNLNNAQTPSSISHKVIHENSHPNPKKTLSKNMKLIDQQIVMKKPHKQKNSQNQSSKDKNKNSSVQSSNMNKFHSHRQSLGLNYRQMNSSQRANSQDKENTCPNINLDYKKAYQHQNKAPLSKLSFILEKDFKEKTTLTKKKLLLSNQYPITKQSFNNKPKENLIKQKAVLISDEKESEIRSTSNSIKQSKKSISSGRNHTIEKKKQNIRYICKKDNQDGKTPTMMELEECQNRQPQRKYLKLKSPSNLPQCCAVQQDKTLSIKSLLKALIDCGSNSQNEQSKNMKKIIDCLTTNDNEPFQDQMSRKFSYQEQGIRVKQSQYQQINKQSGKQIDLKINGFDLTEVLNAKQLRKAHHQSKTILNQPNDIPSKYHLKKSDQKQLMQKMKEYETKIAELYQELIQEKGKRYKLQQIIEKYIIDKQQDYGRF